jgi:ribonuclease PH
MRPGTRKDRHPQQVRTVTVTPGVNRYAEGSALVHWGHTQVLATVTVEPKLPPHLRGQGHKGGWLTAEYALLPRSTQERKPRERLYAGGRTQEIQRLIGRAMRSALALEMFPNQTLTVDVDVLQADGGTRCAGILAGYAALHEAAGRLVYAGKLAEWPLRHEVAAVSVGLVGDEALVDLDFAEDSAAALDLNVVATAQGDVVEVQGGSEGQAVPAERYVHLVAQGVTAVQRLLERVRPQLK